MRARFFSAAALFAASALAIVGCASSSGSGAASAAGLGDVWPQPPAGEVIAQGTVMDVAGDVELCLGAIAESYPPQCSGIPLEGWSWNGVEGFETVGDVTWGAYAVQGTYDGESFAVTGQPILLALYDPMPLPDPTEGRPGKGSAAELETIQSELPAELGADLLSSSVADGWLWIDVVWDDGTRQDAADALYGDDLVVVRSAIRTVQP